MSGPQPRGVRARVGGATQTGLYQYWYPLRLSAGHVGCLGKGSSSDAFRLGFGLVKEIVALGSCSRADSVEGIDGAVSCRRESAGKSNASDDLQAWMALHGRPHALGGCLGSRGPSIVTS